ncbi:MAG: transketolase [Coriobacteriia bacterium]|nr:transketolase [Coriobacteriia bacterium]MBS5477692.1 transketolase [Coriobacteriia bacterium]
MSPQAGSQEHEQACACAQAASQPPSPAFDADKVRAAAAQMRRDIVTMLEKAGSGHPGGSLSATEIVATLYFGGVLRHDPANPADPSRDRFILSKGHCCPALYAALAESGYFPTAWLDTLRKLGSHLQGHPDMRKCPGVEVSTGSLGQGLSVASGLALGLTWDDAQGAGADRSEIPHVYVLMGDGELQEGQVWEAAMFAAQHKLGNLVAIVDNNNLQIDGHLQDVVDLGDIAEKFASFGWYVVECADGNDVDLVHEALVAATAVDDRPAVVVAHTVKGKGVSFMEDQAGWHGKAPNAEQLAQALAEINAAAEACGLSVPAVACGCAEKGRADV